MPLPLVKIEGERDMSWIRDNFANRLVRLVTGDASGSGNNNGASDGGGGERGNQR